MYYFIKIFFVYILFFNTSIFAQGVLQSMDNQEIPMSSLIGKWVFINYWASWCHPCVEEIPELNRFYEENKQNIAIFAVNYDALPLTEQLQLIKQVGIKYPSLKEDPAETLQLGEIRGVPVTFVFNPQGKLVKTLYGSQTKHTLKKIVA